MYPRHVNPPATHRRQIFTSKRLCSVVGYLGLTLGGCDKEPTREIGGTATSTAASSSHPTETNTQHCPTGQIGCPCASAGSPCNAGLYCVAGLCETSPGSDGTGTTTHGTNSNTSNSNSTDATSASGTDNTATTTPTSDASTATDISTEQDNSGSTNTTSDGACSKVDFLLVVDNSRSMQDEQNNLIASIPSLLDLAAAHTSAADAHFMVVDTGYETLFHCESDRCTCGTSSTPVGLSTCCPQACEAAEHTSCNDVSCNEYPDPCQFRLGTGRTFDSTFASCGFANEQRYVTGDQANATDLLNCALDEGIRGIGLEKIAHTMTTAVSGSEGAVKACNQGFLRDDAVLFVVFVTDEEDKYLDGSPGTPSDWIQALKAVKHNEPDSIVMLGIYGDVEQPNAICLPIDQENGGTDGAEASPRLREFVEGFQPYGHSASVCAPDYRPAFQEGFVLLEQACAARRARSQD